MLQRQPGRLLPDPTRVIARPLPLPPERTRRVIERVASLDEATCERQLREVLDRFAHRHRDFEAILARHAGAHDGARQFSRTRRLLLGAFFTQEYAIEGAALFNPSIVLHPDQAGAAPGEARVLLSFRATGEGHISSVTFRAGTLSPTGELRYDPPARYATLPAISEGASLTLAFPADSELGERVLFPMTPDERNGIEDVRLTRFVEEDGGVHYYGLYTAYDGQAIRPKLFESDEFRHFRLHPLVGAAVQNKGFALFPRRIGGEYVMLGRQDNEHNFIMRSPELTRWEGAALLRGPAEPREFIQIGNNGAPIETPAGWLVLTHGVGPMREYTLGVDLLDLDDPARLIARLDGPLLAPDESEREGYVPNVLYSCGALLYNGRLILPYALSDAACAVATVELDELLGRLRPVRRAGGTR